ncbi:hypothetical protein M758_6G066500 [Ceratodon purpureus]|nr:hypothetical protein M758_6G066500 [Ceratodon purpureus]
MRQGLDVGVRREEGNMASGEYYSTVQVLYQLSWEGKLEHPHMITVQYPSGQDGLLLRDVKKRLTALRGLGISHSFSWSYKRNYKSTFIWNDLSDNDLVHPLSGSGEYVLKGSQLIDAFAKKAAEYQNEQKQCTFSSQPNDKADVRQFQTMSVDKLAIGAEKKVESTKGVAIDIPQTLLPLSVEQETIDMEKSDFCLSSSDNEISPRPTKLPDSKPVNDHTQLVVSTRSPTMQGLQTPPPNSRVTSPTEAPFSPGSAKRLWKREIRKSVFRTRNTNASPVSEKHEIGNQNVCDHATSQPSQIERSHKDASPRREARSKGAGNLAPNETVEKEKEAEQSTSQLIRLLWSRWTGGSSRGKRNSNNPCEASSTSRPCQAVKGPEAKANPLPEMHHSPITSKLCEVRASPSTQVGIEDIPAEEPAHRPAQKAALHVTDIPAHEAVPAMNAPSHKSPQHDTQVLETQHLCPPDLQIVLDSPATDAHVEHPEAEIETPKPAIARIHIKSVKKSNGLPRVKTTVSPKPLPPGFHKGTNDTKPVQTPRRSFRSSISVASPPLRRSLSKPDGPTRSFSGVGGFVLSPDQNSVTSTPSPQSKAVHEIKKCINFGERDERPLIPGVTTLDWEKALQEAANDCLPPPNFGEFLQECSTCGRTFKPDSLLVHMRGCHPPQYARAFSLRASPHMLRSRAP